MWQKPEAPSPRQLSSHSSRFINFLLRHSGSPYPSLPSPHICSTYLSLLGVLWGYRVGLACLHLVDGFSRCWLSGLVPGFHRFTFNTQLFSMRFVSGAPTCRFLKVCRELLLRLMMAAYSPTSAYQIISDFQELSCQWDDTC